MWDFFSLESLFASQKLCLRCLWFMFVGVSVFQRGALSLMNSLSLKGFHWWLLISPDTAVPLLSMTWQRIGMHQSHPGDASFLVATHTQTVSKGSRWVSRFSHHLSPRKAPDPDSKEGLSESNSSWPTGAKYCSDSAVTPEEDSYQLQRNTPIQYLESLLSLLSPLSLHNIVMAYSHNSWEVL